MRLKLVLTAASSSDVCPPRWLPVARTRLLSALLRTSCSPRSTTQGHRRGAGGGLDEFKSQLETVDGDLDQLTNDAKSEFSEQVEAVATTWEALGTSVEAATADPSADTLAAASTALSAFTTEVQALISDVKSTC